MFPGTAYMERWNYLFCFFRKHFDLIFPLCSLFSMFLATDFLCYSLLIPLVKPHTWYYENYWFHSNLTGLYLVFLKYHWVKAIVIYAKIGTETTTWRHTLLPLKSSWLKMHSYQVLMIILPTYNFAVQQVAWQEGNCAIACPISSIWWM